MNLQERLLQNEIKHLGQIIQTLSYELVVLQDFLKEEHGSKFEKFRVKYSSSSTSSSDSSVSHKISTNSGSLKKDAKKERRKENDDMEVVGNDDDDFIPETPDDDESDTNFKDIYSDTPMALKDPLDSESNKEHKGGRKKTKVWKYFDKVTLSNGKFSARCHKCRSLVSSQATRMVQHWLKCKQNVRMGNDHKPERKHVMEIRKVAKMNNGEFEDELFDEKSCIDQSGNDNDSKSANKSGRCLDTIWNYFETVYHHNLKKAKCVSCGQFVSPKAIRMRHHKMNCQDVEETKASGTMKSANFLHDDGMGEFSDEEGFLSSSSDDEDKNVTDENKVTKRTHHNKDTIWNYFEVVRHNGLKKAKCVSCGQHVSPKAVRMRQHKIGCTDVQEMPTTMATATANDEDDKLS